MKIKTSLLLPIYTVTSATVWNIPTTIVTITCVTTVMSTLLDTRYQTAIIVEARIFNHNGGIMLRFCRRHGTPFFHATSSCALSHASTSCNPHSSTCVIHTATSWTIDLLVTSCLPLVIHAATICLPLGVLKATRDICLYKPDVATLLL